RADESRPGMKKSAARTALPAGAKRVIFHSRAAFGETARLHVRLTVMSIVHLSVNILTRGGTELTLF
ncbi:MAG TPA: hypothetical protein VMW38_24870, partial [Terriglobia bacterium]|nr:hypothetical protein [Terriglobia bacterium]